MPARRDRPAMCVRWSTSGTSPFVLDPARTWRSPWRHSSRPPVVLATSGPLPRASTSGLRVQHGRCGHRVRWERGPARRDRGENAVGVPAHPSSRVRGLGRGREKRQGDARGWRSVDRASGAMSIPARDEIDTRQPVLLCAVDLNATRALGRRRELLDLRSPHPSHRTAAGRKAHQRQPAAHQQQEHTPRTTCWQTSESAPEVTHLQVIQRRASMLLP
jgi:hypothetical protein